MLLIFVVIGVGFIGVEMVGIIVELVYCILLCEFCRMDICKVCILLVEVGLCILFVFSEDLL